MDDLNELIHQRGVERTRLTLFRKFVLSISEIGPNDVTRAQINELSMRLGKMRSSLNSFDEIQDKIDRLDTSGKQLKEREETESSFYSNMSQAQEIIETWQEIFQKEKVSSTVSNAGVNKIKLPPLKLPLFNGNPHLWLEFRDIYLSLIHKNDDMDDICKFHYLKSYLEGEASVVIKSVTVCADNYEIAWSLLCERYNNKRLLVSQHLKCLFNIEPLSRETDRGMRNLIDSISKNLQALKTLGECTDKWDTLIIYMATTKLDNATARRWEEFRNDIKDSPTLNDFFKFLRNRADVLETVSSTRPDFKNEKRHVVPKTKSFIASASDAPSTSYQCMSCKQNHRLVECPKFKSLSIDDRYTQVIQWKLCKNCLRPGHHTYQCRSIGCKICKRKHSTILHKQTDNQQLLRNENANASATSNTHLPQATASSSPEPAEQQTTAQAQTSITLSTVSCDQVLLSTALLEVTCDGNKHVLRALLDSGSQSSFISEKAQKIINCKTMEVNRSVSGINNTTLQINKHCDLIINSMHSNFSIPVKFYVVPTITDKLPNMKVTTQLNIPTNINLADPQFCHPSEVDLLLGSDVFWDLIGSNQIKLGRNKPVLTETELGWIVAGPTGGSRSGPSNSQEMKCNFSQDIKDQLAKFWELEELPATKVVSSEDTYCENLFNDTTYRDADGRFTVTIPLRESPDVLGDSYKMAERRFLNIEKRLSKDQSLRQAYSDFIHEYKNLGHLTEIPRPEFGSFIPHHSVIRQTSETTRLRVVFDASAATTTGKSFNDIQYVGPVVQDDLLSILMRFRQHTYVVTADVEKMYRQVLVEPSQRYLQLILWRDEVSEPIRVLQLNTVSYGTASAPYLSTRCLLQLAKECEDEAIKQVIEHDFYIDDLLSGSQTEVELSHICESVTNKLKSACFPLRKFHTNAPMVVKNSLGTMIPKDLDVTSQSSVLGLIWHPVDDKLQFSTQLDMTPPVTKRTILSNSAKIFDPLGLLSAITITPKIILQRLWLTKLDWDDLIPAELSRKWQDYVGNLKCLTNIDIPRCVLCPKYKTITLHSFSDASQEAYAGCIYLSSIDSEGTSLVRLLCAKAKVAPLKPTSIPRLELLGALLSVRLSVKVKQALRCRIDQVFHWTDSSVVLSWLEAEPRSLKTFVSNRVGAIQELSPGGMWRHIPGDQNPADLASRGVDPQQLCNSALWWQGPSFLSHDISTWPQLNKSGSSNDVPEIKTYTQITENQKSASALSKVVDFTKYSKLSTLQRTFAYVKRFIFNLNNPNSKMVGHLTADELNSSLHFLSKQSQQEAFTDDLNNLKTNKTLPVKSRILSLTPFLDESGLLRVGGRLKHSPETYNKKHPIIVDSNHPLTKLIFEHMHRKLLHGGPQLLLSMIRETFWPLRGRILARSTVNNCKTCKIMKAKNINPLMGNLPEPRVTPNLPFHVCGVDFAGPFLITDRKGRGCRITKCYLSLFVCFSTKAVHLELASDLTTDCFIQCLRRFISRRGKPSKIFSDNGTNFVGASNEIGRFLRADGDSIASYAENEGIKFHFSPALSPHFNGLTEAGVKSAKFHLARVLGNTHMTFEELSTLFTQIEAILNSRPLTPLSSDPNDFEPLSPGHFLIGKALLSLPSPSLIDINPNRLSRYQHIERMRQQFWLRWHKEFLSELQQKTKWRIKQEGLQINDMVVLKEPNLPPMKWRLGRIQKLYPGDDGIARVADVQTTRGIFRRAIHKLCALPKESSPVTTKPSSTSVPTAAASSLLEALPARGGGVC